MDLSQLQHHQPKMLSPRAIEVKSEDGTLQGHFLPSGAQMQGQPLTLIQPQLDPHEHLLAAKF